MKLAALVVALALAAAPVSAEPGFTPGGQAQIGAVVDGETIALADGRTLRLVGIEAPRNGALARQAVAALTTLVAGRTVELRFAGIAEDRQGRVLAQLYAGGVWVQGELLRRGLARVESAADERVGVPDMLALERQARRYRRGIWSDPDYAVRSADEAANFAGTFQLVSGTVTEVATVAGQVFVSLGPDRQKSLALSIARPALALCRAAGLDPASLKGKRILVRGFIDGATRPRIAISHPEQIELLRARK